MQKTIYAAAISLLLAPSIAGAEFPLGEYRQLRQDPEIRRQLDDYIIGAGRGIFWANVLLGVQKKGQFFCMPKKLSLDKQIILSLLEQELRAPSKGTSYNDETPVELILASAFVHRFPCE